MSIRDSRCRARHTSAPASPTEFASRLSASADVVVARGVDLYVIRNTNVDPVSLQRLNPNYSSISAFGNGGTSRYWGLHVQATIPGSGYFVKIAYSLATSRSNTNSTLSTGAATNPFDYSEDEGPADNDVRHNLALNGSSLLSLGIQLSGIVSFRTALPYSATTSAPRPDGKPFAFRPEPRNARRGDSAFSADLRIAKVLALGSSRSVSVFTELFNVTNAVNYSGYIGTIASSRFGEPTTAAPNRRVQLGFRLEL
jgi:hypothetical protein